MVKMIDISEKRVSKREATAKGVIKLNKAAFDSILNNTNKKGDVVTASKIAGINAAKETSNLIPLAHLITINYVKIDIELITDERSVLVISKIKSEGKTGVEIEALISVQICLMTIYDMCKYLDKSMIITDVELLIKKGGKSGVYRKGND